MKIGVRLESLGLPLRRALETVSRLSVPGVQLDAVGDLAPKILSQTGRRELRNILKSLQLELTALGCPMRHGLDIAENQEQRIDHVREVMSLSVDLGPRRVVVEAGRIPDDPQTPAGTLLSDSLRTLGQHGDRIGAVLALETGHESGETLARFLDRFDTGGLGVNLDPANLLIHGFDVYAAIEALGKRIVHTHIKDARTAGASRTAAEVALGHGDIDWMRFLALLEEVDYQGWLTLEREGGERRLADITEGVGFLRRLVR